jgi:hypothetical protein
MRRDVRVLRKNLEALAPTLSPDEIGLIVECLGYELLSRSIVQGRRLVDASLELLLVDRRPGAVPVPVMRLGLLTLQ